MVKYNLAWQEFLFSTSSVTPRQQLEKLEKAALTTPVFWGIISFAAGM
jgi:hypothetical protein